MNKSLKILIASSLIFFLFRYIPHPPNFTPILAICMYGTIFYGPRVLIIMICSYALVDLVIGFHKFLIFTWGSLALIGLVSVFYKNFQTRILGCFISALIFFISTNFGVWLLSEFYTKDFDGLLKCYIFAIPFFTNSILATLIFGMFIEIIIMSKNKIIPLIHK